jgi:hypothetical protein
MKQAQVKKILKSTLRLLVVLRESLKVEGAEGTPIYQSVKSHADLIGLALPNADRLTKEELATIRKQANAVAVLEKVANPDNTSKIVTADGAAALPGDGQMQILGNNPAIVEQVRRHLG